MHIKNKLNSIGYKQIIILLILLVFLVLIVKTKLLYLIYQTARIIIGLLLVLFIPGYISTFVFFSREEIDFAERVALSVGLSISFVVLTVMFSNLYLDIPVNLFTVLAQIAFICLFFAFAKPIKNTFILIYRRIISPSIDRLNLSRKQKYIIVTSGIIGFLLLADIFYPVIMNNQDRGKIEFDQLYNQNQITQIHNIYTKNNIDSTISYEEIQKKMANNFNDKIALIGYGIGAGEIQSGKDMHITLYWYYLDELKKQYNVKLDFTDSVGEVFFSDEYQFAQSKKQFKEGDVIKEEFDITVPFVTEDKEYFLRVSLTDTAGTSMPILYGKFVDPKNRVVLGILHLKPDEDYLNTIYNSTMDVLLYNPQKNTVINTSGIEMKISLMKNFQNKMLLLGASIDEKELIGGQQYSVTYFWKCLENTKKDYTAFVHVVDENDKLAFQQDHKLPFRTSKCKNNTIYVEQYDLMIPPNTPTGMYTIKTGLYYPKTGTRLTLQNSNANTFDVADIFIKSRELIEEELKDRYSGQINAVCYNPHNDDKKYTRTPVTIQNIHPIMFTDKITFLGYNISKNHADIKVSYFWNIKENAKGNYTVKTIFFSTQKQGLVAENHTLSYIARDEDNILCEEYIISDSQSNIDDDFIAVVKLMDVDTGTTIDAQNSVLEIQN
ncbi:MAG: DUF1616 domain-containing protein [Candidatus Aenigmarchaeota archaeon]|nr:DUF1616 domain-containing protein [Candidatus Aenigmarchaeota archaeon]